jgi:hypothetical protein
MVGKDPGAVLLIYGVPAAVGALGLLMLGLDINAPAISMPRLRLPWPLSFLLRRRAGAVAHSS